MVNVPLKMASCFRNVPSKLCCANYLKAANIIHSEITIGGRKPTQPDPEKWNCLLTENKSLVPGCKSFYTNNIYCKTNNLLSYRPKHTSLHYLAVRKDDILLENKSILNHKQPVLSSSSLGGDSDVPKEPTPEGSVQGRPSEEQLHKIFEELSNSLPRIFHKPLNPNFYDPKVILENNFKNKRTVGYEKYILELALFKALAHWKFAHVKLHILKITKHAEDGTIKCRWRIVGIPGMTIIFQFWKFTPGKLKESLEDAPTWFDGFSTYYVGSNGTIIKHILDKMQPDDDRVSSTATSKIAPKVAMFLGLLKEHEEAVMCAVNDGSYSSRVLQSKKNE